jgi:hypothetical protein
VKNRPESYRNSKHFRALLTVGQSPWRRQKRRAFEAITSIKLQSWLINLLHCPDPSQKPRRKQRGCRST